MEIKLFGVEIMYLYFPKILDLPICQSYFEKKIRDWMQNVRLLYTITVNYSGGDTVSCTCSTFEFLSRVNLSGLSLYCTWTGKAGATRLTRSDFMIHTIDLLLLQICVEKVNLSWYYCYLTVTWLLQLCDPVVHLGLIFSKSVIKQDLVCYILWIENIAPLNSSSIEGIIKHFRF